MTKYIVSYSGNGNHEVHAEDVAGAAKKAPPEFNPRRPGPQVVDVAVDSAADPTCPCTIQVTWRYVGEQADTRSGSLLDNWAPSI